MPQFGSPLFWLIAILVMVGSLISSSAGFGFAIVLVGALQFFIKPVELVGVIITLGCVGAGMRVIETRAIAGWSRISYFVIPAFMGVPLGVAILKYLDPVLMKRYMNLALIAGVFMLAYGSRGAQKSKIKGKRKEKIIEPLVGFVCGILGGSCTLSGPPIVMWGVLRGWKKIEMHALWARFFFSIAIFSLISLYLGGIYSRSTFFSSLLLFPSVFAGFKLGTWIRDKITEERFRLYVLSFLFLSGLAGFAISFRF